MVRLNWYDGTRKSTVSMSIYRWGEEKDTKIGGALEYGVKQGQKTWTFHGAGRYYISLNMAQVEFDITVRGKYWSRKRASFLRERGDRL